MILRERHLFEKRLSSPHPIFQKLLRGIAIVTDKNNSEFFISLKIYIQSTLSQTDRLRKGTTDVENL